MALSFLSRERGTTPGAPLLRIERLDVYYGRAHALQQVSLALDHGVLAVVGRNGMGKTTLCNAITGLVPASGSVRLSGEEVLGLAPNDITERGIAYVPQGRRVWPSLSVEEHLKLVRGRRPGAWTMARIYELFPRLAERRHHGGAQLSGGEQQMLAIGRALLLNPRLLVMDEPTEGLAPVIVEQVTETLKSLAGEGEISVLLVEQNLGVAIDVADAVAVMVNGRIARTLSAAELGADRALQEQLLGMRASADYESEEEEPAPPSAEAAASEPRIFTIKRASDGPDAAEAPRERAVRGFTRWNAGDPEAPLADHPVTPDAPSVERLAISVENMLRQARLAAIWGEVLGRKHVGPDDDFFSLGGRPALIATLCQRIAAELARRFRLLKLVQNSTVRKQAELMQGRSKRKSAPPPGVLVLRNSGTRHKIFWVHYLKRKSANVIGDDQSFLSVALTTEDVPSAGRSRPLCKASRLASCARFWPRKLQGPYAIGGLCLGGILAYEIASQLRAAGREVSLLALLDTPHPSDLEACLSMTLKVS